MKAGTRGLALTEVRASPSQLYELCRTYGVWVSGARSVSVASGSMGQSDQLSVPDSKAETDVGSFAGPQRRESMWLTPVGSSPLSLATAVGT
jgi:hypothetical protein